MLHTIGHSIPCQSPARHIAVLPLTAMTRRIVASCGHKQPQFVRLEVDGLKLRLPNNDGPAFTDIRCLLRLPLRERCANCQSDEKYRHYAICPCGRLIAPLEWVSLGTAAASFRWPLHRFATHERDRPEMVVMCLSCGNPGHHSGIWGGAGINSPYLSGTQAGDTQYQHGKIITLT